jgi:hypothetical protein
MHVMTRVPPLARSFQDGGCLVAEERTLRPFAFLEHTHRLGQVATGYWIYLLCRLCPLGGSGGVREGRTAGDC